ncbi:MAG: hypothetical protein WAX80_01465 [Minisyncoccia bacterium]
MTFLIDALLVGMLGWGSTTYVAFAGPVIVAMFLGWFYGARKTPVLITLLAIYLPLILSMVHVSVKLDQFSLGWLSCFALVVSGIFWFLYIAGWVLWRIPEKVERSVQA